MSAHTMTVKIRMSLPRIMGSALCLGICAALLSGCVTARVRNPLPLDQQAAVQMPGFSEVRAWGDVVSPTFRSSVAAAFQPPAAGVAKAEICDMLAISGGAGNGAYGAGLLCGWTQAGNRPRFKIVTGVSTGALMAPFAFLGPDYDAMLSEMYTNISTKEIFLFRFFDLFTMFSRDYAADTKPLRKLAERCFDELMIERIAIEHRRGRRLYVGTTALDAQRPVIWDMGAIAASAHPGKVKLFRDILLASAAIPVAFPPVYLSVEAGGQKYDEMHVDGGLINQVFIYEAVWGALEELPRVSLEMESRLRVFVLRNNHLTPDWEPVKPRLVPIAKRSLNTITKSNSNGDLFRIYTYAEKHGADFNLAFIPADLPVERKEEFDKTAMRELYLRGYAEAAAGYPWHKKYDASMPAPDNPPPPRRAK